MSEQHNPPAFPGEVRSSTGVAIVGMNAGMTLRDWFAGQAIIGMLSRGYGSADSGVLGQSTAQHAYELADCLLTERAKAQS